MLRKKEKNCVVFLGYYKNLTYLYILQLYCIHFSSTFENLYRNFIFFISDFKKNDFSLNIIYTYDKI